MASAADHYASFPGPSFSLICTLIGWAGTFHFGPFSRLVQKSFLSEDTSPGLSLVIDWKTGAGTFVFLPGALC